MYIYNVKIYQKVYFYGKFNCQFVCTSSNTYFYMLNEPSVDEINIISLYLISLSQKLEMDVFIPSRYYLHLPLLKDIKYFEIPCFFIKFD